MLEKLTYALVIIARCLRSYFFLSHSIIVLTNSAIGQMIHNITRALLSKLKRANFLVEPVDETKEEVWKVFVDGSSSKQGSGAGILLVSP